MLQSRERRSSLYFLIISGTAFILFYLLNKKTPYLSDDYMYHFFFRTVESYDAAERITNLTQIVRGMKNHYFSHGGRIISTAILQMILLVPKTVFNLINSIMFVVLGGMIYLHANWRKNSKPLLLLLIYIMMFVYLPDFALATLWVSGAVNYLWPINVILLFLLFFREEQKKEICLEGWKQSVFIIMMALFGFCTGAANENTGGAAAGLATLFSIFIFVKYRRVKLWQVVAIVFAFLGNIFIIIAPGNMNRAVTTVDTSVSYLDRLNVMKIVTLRTTAELFLVMVVILMVAVCIMTAKKKLQQEVLWNTLFYLVAAVVGFGVMIFSVSVYDRNWFGTVVFLLVIIMSLSGECYDLLVHKRKKKVSLLIVALCVLVFSVYFNREYSILNENYKKYSKIERQLSEQIQEGISDVLVVKYFDKFEVGKFSAYKPTANLGNASSDWLASTNRWIAAYYDIHSYAIVTLPAEAEPMEEK